MPGQGVANRWINPQLGRMNISPCSVNYAKVLADPWMVNGPSDICLPDTNSVSSFKFQTRNRGTMTCNAEGFGFITLDPIALANAALVSILFSNSGTGGVGTQIVPATGVPAWCAGINSNSPFEGSSPPTAPTNIPLMRCVVAGVRIRYSGTELNRGGTIVCYKSKTLTTSETASNASVASVLQLNTSNAIPVDRKWHGISWTPNDETDANYIPIGTPWDVIAQSSTKNMAILVKSVAGNTFDFDVAGYFEAIPYSTAGNTAAPPSVSRSESDVEGYSFIKSVYAGAADNISGPGLWNLFQTAAKAYYVDEIPLASAFASGLSTML